MAECLWLALTPGLFTGKAVGDQSGITSARAQVEAHCSDPQQTARFLAAAAPHSGDWLLALPISSCGLRLSDDAVRVAVALRLGCSVCVTDTCRCGSLVDTHGLHGLVCKKAQSRTTRHHAVKLSTMLKRHQAGINSALFDSGRYSSEQRAERPDENRWQVPRWADSLIPWQAGKLLSWDVTVVSTLADSYVSRSSQSAGGAAEAAANRKHSKYANLPETCTFQLLVFETHGATHSSALDFLNAVGGCLAAASGDPREISFLRQRVSVLIQRFNAILIGKTFLHLDKAPDL